MNDSVDALVRITSELSLGQIDRARTLASTEAPFVPLKRAKRNYSPADAVQVFVRDGFRCRYSGDRLVFPGALRLISQLIPEQIPYHPNWKLDECHALFWHLSPTVDHIRPVPRGGLDELDNWACTSMLRNGAKAHWTLEELGWELRPVPQDRDWDGLLPWYINHVEKHAHLMNESFFHRWYRAARVHSQQADAADDPSGRR